MFQPPSGKPICRPVNTALFYSPEYLCLSETGHSRAVLLFLLIHPHGGTFHLPGLYQTGPESMRETLKMPRRAFLAAYEELKARNIVMADEAYRLLWVPCALRLVGPPVNPNVVKGYCRSIGQLPPSGLVAMALPAYREMLAALGERFVEPFENAFGCGSEGLVRGAGNGSGSQSAPQNHSNKNKNTDPHHNQNAFDASGGEDFRTTALVEHLKAYAARMGWQEQTVGRIALYVQQNSEFSVEELRACECSAETQESVRDPLSYLFAIARRRRNQSSGRQNAFMASDGCSFSAFSDGQPVNFDE